MKLLTKADMCQFYKRYFNPSSSHRARLAVYLYARKAGELDQKIIDLVQKSELGEVPTEQRQSLDLLEIHLKSQTSLSGDQITSIMEEAKQLGLKPMAEENESDAAKVGASTIKSATIITDVRKYKAGLLVNSGPTPVKDLSEFEEVDAKL